MLYNDFKEIISTVLKNSENKDNHSAVHKLICYYFKHIYNGYELPLVIEKFYYNRLYLEVMLTIGKSEKYAEFNEQNMKKFNNLITKTILQSKINSFKARHKLYLFWMGKKENYWGDNEILNYLWKCYPSILDREEVKKLLGLDSNVEKLRIKLSEV